MPKKLSSGQAKKGMKKGGIFKKVGKRRDMRETGQWIKDPLIAPKGG
jgi:hypothetical protein